MEKQSFGLRGGGRFRRNNYTAGANDGSYSSTPSTNIPPASQSPGQNNFSSYAPSIPGNPAPGVVGQSGMRTDVNPLPTQTWTPTPPRTTSPTYGTATPQQQPVSNNPPQAAPSNPQAGTGKVENRYRQYWKIINNGNFGPEVTPEAFRRELDGKVKAGYITKEQSDNLHRVFVSKLGALRDQQNDPQQQQTQPPAQQPQPQPQAQPQQQQPQQAPAQAPSPQGHFVAGKWLTDDQFAKYQARQAENMFTDRFSTDIRDVGPNNPDVEWNRLQQENNLPTMVMNKTRNEYLNYLYDEYENGNLDGKQIDYLISRFDRMRNKTGVTFGDTHYSPEQIQQMEDEFLGGRKLINGEEVSDEDYQAFTDQANLVQRGVDAYHKRSLMPKQLGVVKREPTFGQRKEMEARRQEKRDREAVERLNEQDRQRLAEKRQAAQGVMLAKENIDRVKKEIANKPVNMPMSGVNPAAPNTTSQTPQGQVVKKQPGGKNPVRNGTYQGSHANIVSSIWNLNPGTRTYFSNVTNDNELEEAFQGFFRHFPAAARNTNHPVTRAYQQFHPEIAEQRQQQIADRKKMLRDQYEMRRGRKRLPPAESQFANN